MTNAKITTHVADARSRVLQQYKDKEKFLCLLDAGTRQVQDLEDAFWDLRQKRSIFDAEGTQLDLVGTIVGLGRPAGLGDEHYRLLLFAQIAVNVSEGDPERIISVFKLVTQATRVNFNEYFPAGIGLFSNGEVDESLVPVLREMMNSIPVGGVSVDALGTFDADNPFSFDDDGDGFGDADDPEVGGLLSALYPGG